MRQTVGNAIPRPTSDRVRGFGLGRAGFQVCPPCRKNMYADQEKREIKYPNCRGAVVVGAGSGKYRGRQHISAVVAVEIRLTDSQEKIHGGDKLSRVYSRTRKRRRTVHRVRGVRRRHSYPRKQPKAERRSLRSLQR